MFTDIFVRYFVVVWSVVYTMDNIFPVEIWCHIMSYVPVMEVWNVPELYPYLDKDELMTQRKYIICNAAYENKVDVLEALQSRLLLTRYDASVKNILSEIISYDSCNVIRWIIETYNFPPEEIVKYIHIGEIVRAGKSFGHKTYSLTRIQWMMKTYNLSASDDMIHSAINAHKNSILFWLLENFTPSKSKQAQFQYPLLAAVFFHSSTTCKKTIRLQQWINATFPNLHEDEELRERAARCIIPSQFGFSDRYELFKWLAQTLHLTSEHFHGQYCKHLYNACIFSNFPLVKWLLTEYPITKKDMIHSDMYYCYYLRQCQPCIFNYINDMFHLFPTE